MLLGAVLVGLALALFLYNQWDADRADKASAAVLEEMEEAMADSAADSADDTKLDAGKLYPDPNAQMSVTAIDGYEYIGYITIPALEISLPVMSQWSDAGLRIAPGRYTGTTFGRNLVICGHSYITHFRGIRSLTPGAQILFKDMDGRTWEYQVTSSETIEPTNVEDMITKTDTNDWDLTLFTCTASGQARWAVRCALVE